MWDFLFSLSSRFLFLSRLKRRLSGDAVPLADSRSHVAVEES